MSFAQRLKNARIDKGISQTEIGNLARIHYTKAIEKMNDNNKVIVKTLIDAVITKRQIQQLVI